LHHSSPVPVQSYAKAKASLSAGNPLESANVELFDADVFGFSFSHY